MMKNLLVVLGGLLASASAVGAELPGSYSGLERDGGGSVLFLVFACVVIAWIVGGALWNSMFPSERQRAEKEASERVWGRGQEGTKKVFYYDNGKRID